MNIIIILGPPGSGKGTYSKKLSKRHGFEHVSTGDLLRDRAKVDDDLGREVKDLMAQNILLPDEIVSKVLEDHLRALPAGKTIILDGYPRKMDNFNALHKMQMKHGWNVKSVIAIDVSEAVCTDRILGRGRNNIDKDRAAIAKRFTDYRQKTVPVIKAYEAKGQLLYLNGVGTVEDCVARAEGLLGLSSGTPENKPSPKP